MALAIRNANEWPNIIQFSHDSTGSVMAGNSFNIECVLQSFDSGCTLSAFLDPDQNPYNGNQISLPLTSAINPQPSTARGTRTIDTGVTVPSTTPSGLYYVYAMISNPNGTRYLYSLNRILVTAYIGGTSSAPSIASVYPPTLNTSASPQQIQIIGSGFTSASTLLLNGNALPVSGTLTFISANEIDYKDTFASAKSWSVQVVNGSQTSTAKTFTISTPTAGTGSLVVNLSPAGIGAQWQVDGTGYNNSGQGVGYITPGQYQITFKAVSGYTAPANQSVTITANTQTTVSASYTAIAPSTYTLTLNQGGSQGYVANSPLGSGTGNIYSAGSLVQLTANANIGYHFTGWSGDATGTANPTTITMNGSKSVTANFAAGDPTLGTIVVNIQPSTAATAGVQWGWNSTDYRNSGSSYTTFPGSYFITLHPVDGWISPIASDLFPVTLTAGQTASYTVTFTQDTTPGLLTVTLSPPDAVTAGAKWHVNGGAAQGNGATVSLAPGSGYSVTFDSVSGWRAPASQTVTVQRAQTTVAAGNYTPPAGQPVIGSISPPIGPMTGATLMTINGVNFTSPATILVGGQPAVNVSVSSSTQITCSTPSNSLYGTATVVVQTAGGSTTNSNGFAYGMSQGNKIGVCSTFCG
jgi:uncharacterized repeat protein (TIGR02543 family)